MLAAALIVLAAASLRLAWLPSVPPGLHFDEAANGVIARNIAFGGYRPLFIPDYTGKEVLWFYAAALIMRLIGPVPFALRLTSAGFGVAGVAVAGWLVRRLYADDPRRDALALLTMAILAVAFWHNIISRFADRAITQPLLQALSLGLLWRGLLDPGAPRHLWRMALAGAVTGLAAYTYLAVRLFPIPLALALLTLLIADRGRLRRLPGLAIFVLAALVVIAPLGVYFSQRPEAFTTRIGQVAPTSLAQALIGWRLALRMFFLSGDPLMRFNLPGRPIYGPVLAALMLLGFGVAVLEAARAGRDPLRRARAALLIAWPLVMLAPTALAVGGITPSNLRAIGLAPLIAFYPALGLAALSGWLRGRGGRWPLAGRALIPAALVAVALGGGAQTWLALRRWGGEQALYYDNDGHVAALARYLNESAPSDAAIALATAHYRHPTLAFLMRGEERTRSLFGGEALVIAPQGRSLAAYTRDAAPPLEWQAWLAPYQLAAPPGPDGTPDFLAYLLPADLGFDLPPAGPADFAGVIRLEGARLFPAVSGEAAALDLGWRILAPAPHPDLAVVTEVCDLYGWCWIKAAPDGSLERGRSSAYNSTQWTPGERLLTHVAVPLQIGIPPGEYTVRVSLYSAQADARLPLISPTGAFAGQYAELGPLTIAAGPAPSPGDLAAQYRLDRPIDRTLTLVGYDLPAQSARPGEVLHLALIWQSAGRQRADRPVILTLGGSRVLYRGDPVHGSYPFTRWAPGEGVIDRYAPRLPVDLPPGEYPLAVQLGDSPPVPLGVIAVQEASRRLDPPPMTALDPLPVLGGQIALPGYTLSAASVAPGETLDLTLIWRAEARPDAPYTVFVHIFDDRGTLTQDDRPPAVDGVLYPTDLWIPGEIVVDRHTLTIPPEAAPGDYRLRVGLYLPESGLRLSVPGSPEDAVVLPLILTIR